MNGNGGQQVATLDAAPIVLQWQYAPRPGTGGIPSEERCREALTAAARAGCRCAVFDVPQGLDADAGVEALARHGAGVGLEVGLRLWGLPGAGELDHLQRWVEGGVRELALIVRFASEGRSLALAPGVGDWDALERTTQRILRTGVHLAIETHCSQALCGCLDEAAARFARMGVSAWSVVFPVRDFGELSPRVMEDALRELARLGAKGDLDIRCYNAPHFRRIVVESRLLPLASHGPSWLAPLNDGRGLMCVTERGKLTPSAWLPVDCGNLLDDDMIDVYRFHPTFRTLRDDDLIEGACQLCNYRRLCGGCRARAYAASRQLLGHDPLCAYAGARRPALTFP